ncbi:MAG: tRNA pseudouridine(38-40) synthase TruA [Bacteroidales bacterium]|nr:tRNA pseudouridine(38-40) synthase TruA [Bacteroidales bacterium]
MMRYRIVISYDGAPFYGYQVQPGHPSVQECVEAALSRLLGGDISITGAGRTDTGVHAVGYVAHFDVDGELPYEEADFCYKLNSILPRQIVVHSVAEAADDFHARFDATRREYTYFLHRIKDPFVDNYSWRCGYPALDFDAMNQAAQHLLGTHDFSAFEKTGGDNKTSICTVYEAFWAPYTPSHVSVMGYLGNEYWYFRIAANRFLRNMVRATVGTLIEVGRGRRSPDSVIDLLASGTRSDAGESVPAHALFLSRVDY